MPRERLPLLGLAALLTASAGCTRPAEAEGPRPTTAHQAAARSEGTVEDEPAAAASGAEIEEPPAPDAATLADGRALAVPGPEGFLTTWRLFASPDDALAEADADARLVAQPDARLELAELGARSVTLGATLLVPRETHAWLLIGLRGSVVVRLDGAELGQGASEDRFRQDLVLVRVPLAAGERRLSLTFARAGEGAWRGQVRWLDARGRPGPGNVAIALGRPEEASLAETAAAAVRFAETHELRDGVPVLRARADLPGGGLAVPISARLGDEHVELTPPAGLPGAHHELFVPLPARGALALEGAVGARAVRLGVRVQPDRRALLAAASLERSLARASELSRAPIAWRRDELLRVVREGDGDAAWRALLVGEASRIERALDRGVDPFGAVRGYERMAFFSRLDGTAQEYELFVPRDHRADRPLPLLVTLHGFKGNAGDYFRNTFGLARAYEDDESLIAHGRHGEPPRSGPMIVIGPTGRGQSQYRYAGEVDVLEAIEDARRRFAVDPDRIYVTGGSMGGTGAAYLPFRQPDLFAASAALAGYHDQRVRSDTDQAALSDAERFLVAHRSDVDWAENARHLPMLLVRGTRDVPLAWTRSLVTRLQQLGYRHEHREPELGHNVWTETYANGAIFRYLGRYRRPTAPAHVVLRTARERTREAYWVRVEQREAPDRFAHVDARYADGTIAASVEGARAVTFSPGAPLHADGAPLTVEIGEARITGAAPLTIERDPVEGWRAATGAWPEPLARRPGIDGPIREVFHEPLTFVVGTQDPDHTLVNRLVAEHWAHPHGQLADYPIVDDTEVTEAMIAERTLVVIGPPSSNLIHARMLEGLPIRVDDEVVRVGETAHAGEQVGAAFVARSPLAPARSVLVIAGPRPLGTLHANALPDILPDYVVFDERVAAARDRWACGGTGCAYLAHGFFDMTLRLPE